MSSEASFRASICTNQQDERGKIMSENTAPAAPTVEQVVENGRAAATQLMQEKRPMPSATSQDLSAAHFARAANFEALAAACLMGKGQEMFASMSQGQGRA